MQRNKGGEDEEMRGEEILTRWYVGEVGGEALFSTLAADADGAVGDKWRALARVEALMAGRLARTLADRGVEVPVIDGVARRARERCDAVVGRSWTQRMEWLRGIADAALSTMRDEAAELPEEFDAIGRLVIDHEVALVDFATWEIAGDEVRSSRIIAAFAESGA